VSVLKAKDFNFDADRDPLLGFPTINIGKISGGMNINSVPDHAEFTIDIRSTTKTAHKDLLSRLAMDLGPGTKLETLVDLEPVYTHENDPFVQLAYDVCGIDREDTHLSRALPYLTDGSVLQRLYNGAPVIILGPGQPEMAHQTDEYCHIRKLEESIKIYTDIITNWKNHL
jgi:succinyl-diaminopimelate desuccinylase